MMLLYVLGSVVFINCGYYLLFSKFSFLKTSKSTSFEHFPVSLVVCAKNEGENLQRHIPLWLNQSHPSFELILINDASIDNTLEVMEFYADQDSRIQIVNVKNNEAFWGNKKYALTLGIKRAKYEHLVFTDADCYPASTEWLSTMVSNFSAQVQLVLGYGGYEKENSFLNKIIRFETLMTATQYFSYAKVGIPYMGVGRNLAYTSTLYYENNGFMKHIKLASGDDDLFVNEVATATNTAICVEPEAFTYSIPKKKQRNWRIQKKRHYSTARLYKPTHRLLLGLFYVSNLLFWILLPIVLIAEHWQFSLPLILFRFMIQYIVMGKAAKKLQESDLIPWLPFYEVFLVISQMVIFISNSSDKNSRWK